MMITQISHDHPIWVTDMYRCLLSKNAVILCGYKLTCSNDYPNMQSSNVGTNWPVAMITQIYHLICRTESIIIIHYSYDNHYPLQLWQMIEMRIWIIVKLKAFELY